MKLFMEKENNKPLKVFLPQSLQHRCRDNKDILFRNLEIGNYIFYLVDTGLIPAYKYKVTLEFYIETEGINGLIISHEENIYRIAINTKKEESVIYLS